MKEEICIVGAGGHAKVVIEIAELLDYNIKGIYDLNETVEDVLHYPVSHNFESIKEGANLFFALGNNQNRKKNSESFKYQSVNLIHPAAVVSKNSQWGIGNVVMAGAVVNSSVKIGNHCIINTSASVDHDCKIEDFAHISPQAALAGNVKVGEGAQVGIGACVIQNVTIGKWSVIGAGSVVIEDVPDNVIVVGNPAKVIKYIE
ncbi:acetyltransferase [Chryseobacterium sp. KACC 21268]|nr:acetyltransferase [Chryseobacterium sp. KACC 21268]